MKPNRKMYRKFSLMDFIIIVASLITLAVLIFFVKYSNDRSKAEREKLAQTNSNDQESLADDPLHELSEALIINEVNQAGWIELYNKDKNADIELSGCYITVNGVKKYTFPLSEVIRNGELLCAEELGAFKEGPTVIGIFDENGGNLHNLMLPRLESMESYGCRTDGDIRYCYLAASKNTSNSENDIIMKDRLAFSVPGGFYEESFQLELTAAEGMTIYYTLDGTEPTTDSEVYEEPILIKNMSGSDMKYATAEGISFLNSYQPASITIGMVVRAIAVGPDGKKSESESQSYYIGMKEAGDLRNIPVLSIITAPENLFDYFEGIYVSGRTQEDALARGEDGTAAANYLNGWEKEVHVEYFEPGKDKTFEGNMKISTVKDYSVSFPQKSLLLTAEGGAFAGSSLTEYYNEISKKLAVQTNRTDNNYKIREYLAGRLLSDTTVGTPNLMPCVVFINGEYWGGYMLRAEYDERYIKTHYGVDEEEVLIASDGLVINKSDYQNELNDLYVYIAEHDLKEDKDYAWIKAHMDIQNYLEYFCANMYLANAEYGQDKVVMWRTINDQGTGYEDGKWRFLMPRLDNTMMNKEAGKVATSSINTYLQIGVSEDDFFKYLLRNDEFKRQLLQVMTAMADDIFTEERANAILSELSVQMKKMVIMSYKRFNGNMEDTYYAKELDKIESFFMQRDKYILRYTAEVISQGGISSFYDDAVFE